MARQNKASAFIGMVIIIIVAAALFGGVFAYQRYFARNNGKISNENKLDGWKTYKNDELGFSIKYPDGGIVTEDGIKLKPIVPGTSLTEKVFGTIGDSLDANSYCDLAYAWYSEEEEIGGKVFKKSVDIMGGESTGVRVYTIDYALRENDKCIYFFLRLSGLSKSPLPQFDEVKESEVFKQMISTFKFTK